MELFFQATAAVLLAVILSLVLNNNNKELGLLLTVAACSTVMMAAGRFLQPVIDFLKQLQEIGQLNSEYLSILLKVVGIGFLAEVTALVCTDAGNGTLGKTLQMLASCVILWLAIPLLSGLLDLVQELLGGV